MDAVAADRPDNGRTSGEQVDLRDAVI